MRPIDVVVNLKNYDMWDIDKYKMSKEEAEVCVTALGKMIPALKDMKSMSSIVCPSCKKSFHIQPNVIGQDSYYCSACGQKLI